MRAVVQRVARAEVRVGDVVIGSIGGGVVALLGVGAADEGRDAEWMASKIAHLRIFEDEAGKFARSALETGGAVLAISQFTLLGDAGKGRRPSFTAAAAPEKAEALYGRCVEALREHGLAVATGRFGARMRVELVNDGPVTIWLDSRGP